MQATFSATLLVVILRSLVIAHSRPLDSSGSGRRACMRVASGGNRDCHFSLGIGGQPSAYGCERGVPTRTASESLHWSKSGISALRIDLPSIVCTVCLFLPFMALRWYTHIRTIPESYLRFVMHNRVARSCPVCARHIYALDVRRRLGRIACLRC